MTKVAEYPSRIKAHIHLVKAGYAEAPEGGLFLYNIEDLNSPTFDFKSAKPKSISRDVKTSETGDEIEWHELDIKRPMITVVTKTSATVFDGNISNITPGEELFCQVTRETAYVASVSGNTVTLVSPGFTGGGFVANAKIVRIGFAKTYGANDSLYVDQNDTVALKNYYQFTERLVKGDIIENNKDYLFYDTPEDKQAEEYTTASRNIMFEMVCNFFVGKKSKISGLGGKFRYTSAGLDSFIPAGAKVNITGATDADTKIELGNQLQLAYQSGLAGLNSGSNKLIALCTSKFSSKIGRLYESKQIQDVTVLTNTGVKIKHVDCDGFDLNIVRSGVMDYLFGSTAICYLIPVDYAGMQMFPNGRVKDDGKTLMKFGTGVVWEKPATTYEVSEHALFTAYTYIFKGVSTGAFRVLTMS